MTVQLAFLLSGQVQGVKMRRYVESAARHFGLAGYVINIDETGDVFGEAWVAAVGPSSKEQQLEQFHKWIRGQWEPREYHNVKPTPIGTAYPAKARVHQCATILLHPPRHTDTTSTTTDENFQWMERFATFAMVRDDAEAEKLASERKPVHQRLRSMCNNNNTDVDHDVVPTTTATTCTWPEPL